MFNLLHSSTNQELFEKHLCNQGSHYEKYGLFPLCTEGSLRYATTKLTVFTVIKDEWNTKECTGKSRIMHWTYCGMPKGTSQAETMSNNGKIKPGALAISESH